MNLKTLSILALASNLGLSARAAEVFSIDDPAALARVVDAYAANVRPEGTDELDNSVMRIYAGVETLAAGRPAGPTTPQLVGAFAELTAVALAGSARMAVARNLAWTDVPAHGWTYYFNRDLRPLLYPDQTLARPAGTAPLPASIVLLMRVNTRHRDPLAHGAASAGLKLVTDALDRVSTEHFGSTVSLQANAWLRALGRAPSCGEIVLSQ